MNLFTKLDLSLIGIYIKDVPLDKFTYILYNLLCRFKLLSRNTPLMNKYTFVTGCPENPAIGRG